MISPLVGVVSTVVGCPPGVVVQTKHTVCGPKGGRRKEEGGRRKEEGGRRKEEGGRRIDV